MDRKAATRLIMTEMSLLGDKHKEHIDVMLEIQPDLEPPPALYGQYGKYEVPPSLRRLYELEVELGRVMDLKL